MNPKPKYYVTTAIAYASKKPHFGNTYEAIMTDAIARYKREMGYDVYFCTGTDEHGQKIEDKAKEASVTPQEFVDGIVLGEGGVKDLWKLMNISNDRFIRTTDDYHVEAIQKIFKKMYEKGDIYKGAYKGKYCKPCESFWTESQLVDGKCPDCGREVQDAEEEAYFFRLSKYADRIRELGLADITVEGNCPLLRHYHVKRDDADVFMLFNEDSIHTAKATVTLPVSGAFARLRLIEDGIFADVAADGRVTVELLPGQSEILVFGSAAAEMAHPSMPVLSDPVKVTALNPTYSIELADSEDLTAFYPYKTTDKLFNITSAAEKPSFSGLMRYTFTLNLDEVPANAVLDLGRVGQTAKFMVNGTNAGIRITAPYACPISYLLKKGDNTITIEVANTLVGKIRDPFSHCMPITPSGLLGPIKLLEY